MNLSLQSSIVAAALVAAPSALANSLYGVDFEVVIDEGAVTGTFFGTICFESDTFPVEPDLFNPDNGDLTLTFDFVLDIDPTLNTFVESDDFQFGIEERPEFEVDEGLDYLVKVVELGEAAFGDLIEFSIDDDEFEAEFAFYEFEPIATAFADNGSGLIAVTTFGEVTYSDVYAKGQVIPTPTAAALGLAAIVGLVSRRRR